MAEEYNNSISTKELCREYEWFQNTFSQTIQSSCDDFFGEIFDMKLISISQNVNYLINNESCFVTKIKINKDYDLFFRLTSDTLKLILDKVLGESKSKFSIGKISELEAKVITAFNGSMYKFVKDKLNKPDPKELARKNFDIVNLTFLIEDKDVYKNETGKVIVTLPKALLSPEQITSNGDAYSDDTFKNSETIVKIIVGTTKFSLYNLKNLEKDDIVVFDNSNIEHLKLSAYGETKDFNINPNMELLLTDEYNEGDDDMAESQNIWDNIEVEINAEFDAVKITLGELKDIEEGLVIDLASLYDNNVTLKVEGKPIASGSLVIVNDKYGVKIDNVIVPSDESSENSYNQNDDEEDDFDEEENQDEYSDEDENEEYDEDEEYDENEESNEGEDGEEPQEGDEEFDYSDFELEDDNI